MCSLTISLCAGGGASSHQHPPIPGTWSQPGLPAHTGRWCEPRPHKHVLPQERKTGRKRNLRKAAEKRADGFGCHLPLHHCPPPRRPHSAPISQHLLPAEILGPRGPGSGEQLSPGSLCPTAPPSVPQAPTSKPSASELLLPRVSAGIPTPAAGLWRWDCAVRERGTESPCYGHRAVPTPGSSGQMDAAQLPGALGVRCTVAGRQGGLLWETGWSGSDKPGISAYL